MRILFVTRYIDHVLFFFLLELAKRTSLTVVCEQEGEWPDKLSENAVRLERIPARSRFDRKFQAGIERLWADGQFEVIQCFHGNAQLANLIHWNTRRIPIVGYRAYIGHLAFIQNPSAFLSVRSPKLSGVVAVSTAVKEYLESFRFFRPRNVRVISHGVDRSWVQSQCDEPFNLRSKLGCEDDAFIVMCVASLRPYKHFELIVRAAHRLQSQPIHFVHIGRPNGWDKRAGKLKNVHFLGHQLRPFPIMAEADVVASTSHNEAFGRSNLEAMALGKPLIGSNTGGLLDLIEDGVSGSLFETKNEHHFVRQVLLYFENRQLVQAHGQNAIRRVDEKFSTLRMAQQYINAYQDVIDQCSAANGYVSSTVRR